MISIMELQRETISEQLVEANKLYKKQNAVLAVTLTVVVIVASTIIIINHQQVQRNNRLILSINKKA